MTAEQVKAAKALVNVAIAITEAIKEAGEIPSGHLYGSIMSTGISLENYEYIIRLAVESGRVTKRGDLLIWAEGK